MSSFAAWNHRGESGGNGRRTHPAPTGRGHADSAGGGRDTHRLRQQRAIAHHTERPGAPLPPETLTRIHFTPSLLFTFKCSCFIGLWTATETERMGQGKEL